MMFRNVTFFRLGPLHTDNLESRLQEGALKPVALSQMSSCGFVPPIPGDDGLAYMQQDVFGITLGTQSRLLPASVIADKIAAEVKRIEQETGARPGRGTLRNIKETAIAELLPKAFIISTQVDAIIDTRAGFVAVDTASRTVAEHLVSHLRSTLDTFPAIPVTVGASLHPRGRMTMWASGEALPQGFQLSDSIDLVDPGDNGATVKMRHHPPQCEEAQTHLEAGKVVDRLELTYRDRCSFVLDSQLVLRKFKLLDAATDSLPTDTDSLADELRARFTLMSGELRELYAALTDAFVLIPSKSGQ